MAMEIVALRLKKGDVVEFFWWYVYHGNMD